MVDQYPDTRLIDGLTLFAQVQSATRSRKLE